MISSYMGDKANDVLNLYAEVDGKIEAFQKASSLQCVSGCGRCCENPKIFITVLEALPLACKLWQNKTAPGILAQIVDHPLEKGCVFYQPNASVAGSGRCGIYSLRPLLCRLFGFSAKTDKHGNPSLVTCSIMKSHCAQEYEQVIKQFCEKHWQCRGCKSTRCGCCRLTRTGEENNCRLIKQFELHWKK